MTKTKAVLMRFLKGAIAGAIASIGLVSMSMPQDWRSLKLTLLNLALAGTYGLILALQKWISWTDEVPV